MLIRAHPKEFPKYGVRIVVVLTEVDFSGACGESVLHYVDYLCWLVIMILCIEYMVIYQINCVFRHSYIHDTQIWKYFIQKDIIKFHKLTTYKYIYIMFDLHRPRISYKNEHKMFGLFGAINCIFKKYLSIPAARDRGIGSLTIRGIHNSIHPPQSGSRTIIDCERPVLRKVVAF